MGKVYKLNGKGTLGVSLSKQMQAAGFIAGKRVEWIAQVNGFLLKLSEMPTDAPKPKEEPKPENVLETL